MRIHEEQIASDARCGELGAALIPDGATMLTHCNTGSLATGGIGSALGVIKTAHWQGKRVRVLVDETRPLLQGARLTAWELPREEHPARTSSSIARPPASSPAATCRPSSSAPTASPPTATPRTRSAPTASRSPRTPTTCRSTSSRRSAPSTRRRRNGSATSSSKSAIADEVHVVRRRRAPRPTGRRRATPRSTSRPRT